MRASGLTDGEIEARKSHYIIRHIKPYVFSGRGPWLDWKGLEEQRKYYENLYIIGCQYDLEGETLYTAHFIDSSIDVSAIEPGKSYVIRKKVRTRMMEGRPYKDYVVSAIEDEEGTVLVSVPEELWRTNG